MASHHNKLVSDSGGLWSNFADPRTDNLFLVSSPNPTLVLIALYLLMVEYFLPIYMQKRPAYSLSSVLVYYNIFQVIFNGYLFYVCVIASGYGQKYSIFRCRELDHSTTDMESLAAMKGMYYFYLSKYTEFLDTIFFLLRKKNNQVSFLHLYHHASIPFVAWIGVKFSAGGPAVLIAGLNASIHFFMYLYYLLSGLGPKWQKYVWWKKYMTTAQIIQFIFVLLHTVLAYATGRECPVLLQRYQIMICFFLYVISLLVLFYRFYKMTYNKNKKDL